MFKKILLWDNQQPSHLTVEGSTTKGYRPVGLSNPKESPPYKKGDNRSEERRVGKEW